MARQIKSVKELKKLLKNVATDKEDLQEYEKFISVATKVAKKKSQKK